MGTIYIFTFPDEKQYIGKTTNIKQRYTNHRFGKKKIVDKIIQKVGWNKILKDEINCPDNFLDEVEIIWIKNFNTLYPNGYNIGSGGEGQSIGWFDRHPNKEQIRQKMSEKKIGILQTEDQKRKRSEAWMGSKNPNFGHPLSKEHKKKLSEKKKGSNHPRYGIFGKNNPCSKSIFQFSKDGQFIKEWESGIQIKKELGYDNGTIGKVCVGSRKLANGYIWRFKNDIQ
jgi:group I intron endonuclease